MDAIWWQIFDLLGTTAFAVSGVFAAISRRMDLFGIFVLSAATAVGGGIIRDILIGNIPPAAFKNSIYLWIILGSMAVITIIVRYFNIRMWRRVVGKLSIWYLVCDAIGLGSFTVTGTLTGLSQGRPHTVVYPIMLGLLTAVGGGVLRDLLAQRIPSVLSTDVYATASLAGSLVMCLCWHYESQDLAPWLGAFMVVALRFFAVRYRWQLIHPMERRKRGEGIKNGR